MTADDDASLQRAALRLAFVREHLGADATVPVAASSDAGFRSYWRSRDGHGRSVIVMDSPPALEDVRPWLRLHQLLDEGGVRVPQVLARDVESGLLLLEDLGGPTLLQTLAPDNAAHWFAQALEQLLRLQRIPAPPWLPRYDEALVRRELELFPTWFLQRHLGIELDTTERTGLEQVAEVLVDTFLGQPQVLVHRDFMPRNLMPLADGVAVLDFQDAVCGPAAYDVLSQVRDAFASWPATHVDAWISSYLEGAATAGIALPEATRFRRDVDLIGVQRHLKVLGIFARLHYRDGKPRYLTDAPRFVAYLMQVVPAYAELAPLQTVLQRHVLPRVPAMELPA